VERLIFQFSFNDGGHSSEHAPIGRARTPQKTHP
jgi:hypothetical protein